MSKGISWTGDKTKDFIQTSAENYNLKNPANQTPAQISTGVQKTVQYVSTGSKYVAKGTGAVASAIGLDPKFFKSLFNRLTSDNRFFFLHFSTKYFHLVSSMVGSG